MPSHELSLYGVCYHTLWDKLWWTELLSLHRMEGRRQYDTFLLTTYSWAESNPRAGAARAARAEELHPMERGSIPLPPSFTPFIPGYDG